MTSYKAGMYFIKWKTTLLVQIRFHYSFLKELLVLITCLCAKFLGPCFKTGQNLVPRELGKYPCGIQNHQEPLTHTKRCVSIVTTIQIHSGFRVETNIKTLITYKYVNLINISLPNSDYRA